MISATMSLYALYTYDDTVFDELHLPDNVDKDTIIENLLLDSIELESLYTDPETLKAAISIYTRAKLSAWNNMANVLSLEYNPIWNVDGTVKTEIGARHSNSKTNPITSTENYGQQVSTNIVGTRTSTSEQKVSAYNSNNLTPASGSTATDLGATDKVVADAVENSFTNGEVVNNATSEKAVDLVTRQGNIGVTTTQSMINEEIELRKNNNIYDIIVKDLISRFCILVY